MQDPSLGPHHLKTSQKNGISNILWQVPEINKQMAKLNRQLKVQNVSSRKTWTTTLTSFWHCLISKTHQPKECETALLSTY